MNEHANLIILFIIAKLFEYNVHKKSLNEGGFRQEVPLIREEFSPKAPSMRERQDFRHLIVYIRGETTLL